MTVNTSHAHYGRWNLSNERRREGSNLYYFTSDLHFDHTNIMNHCERPFETVEDMNEALIYYYNKVVAKGDVVVIAGDLTLNTNAKLVEEKFLSRLNGNKILLKGNHDYWLKQKRYLYHKKVQGYHLAVGHYPMRTWQGQRKGGFNLHGHSHGNLRPFYNQLDIGVDVAYKYFGEYRPFSLTEVIEIIHKNNRRRKPWEISLTTTSVKGVRSLMLNFAVRFIEILQKPRG